MRNWPLLAAVAAAVGLFPIGARAQEEIATIFAISAQALTFSAHFVAHGAGFSTKEGLKVTDKNLVGVNSPNAVLAGSADFTMGTGPIFLRAASQRQKFKAIANLVDKPLVEPVLCKDVAADRARQGCPGYCEELRRLVHRRVREVTAGVSPSGPDTTQL